MLSSTTNVRLKTTSERRGTNQRIRLSVAANAGTSTPRKTPGDPPSPVQTPDPVFMSTLSSGRGSTDRRLPLDPLIVSVARLQQPRAPSSASLACQPLSELRTNWCMVRVRAVANWFLGLDAKTQHFLVCWRWVWRRITHVS